MQVQLQLEASLNWLLVLKSSVIFAVAVLVTITAYNSEDKPMV